MMLLLQVDEGRMAPVDQTLPFYMEKLRGIYASEVPILDVNLEHMNQFNDRLYKIVVAYPDVSDHSCFRRMNSILLGSDELPGLYIGGDLRTNLQQKTRLSH